MTTVNSPFTDFKPALQALSAHIRATGRAIEFVRTEAEANLGYYKVLKNTIRAKIDALPTPTQDMMEDFEAIRSVLEAFYSQRIKLQKIAKRNGKLQKDVRDVLTGRKALNKPFLQQLEVLTTGLIRFEEHCAVKDRSKVLKLAKIQRQVRSMKKYV